MKTYDKDFYVQAMANYKTTCEWCGIDLMSKYGNILAEYPNATKAIKKMYSNFEAPNCYNAKPLHFEQPQFVYEAIANFIPAHSELLYTIKTVEQNLQYKGLNMRPMDRDVKIKTLDLVAIILIFTEEFILNPLSYPNVTFVNENLTVASNFVTFKVSKLEEKTHIYIRMKNVMLLEFWILN